MKIIHIVLLILLSLISVAQDGTKINVSVNCELKLGGDTDDINQQFGFPRSIAVDDAGNIFVIDQRLKEIRKFDKSGKYIHTFGKNGDGPGEINYRTFRTPTLAFYNNELYALNDVKAVFYIFNSDGKYLKSIKTERNIIDYLIHKNGRFVTNFFSNPKNLASFSPKVSDARGVSYMVEAMPSENYITLCSEKNEPLVILDSLKSIGVRIITRNGGMNIVSNTPFDARIFYSVMPNGNIVIANSAKNKLSFFNEKGVLLKSIDCKTEYKKIPERDFESFFEIRKIKNPQDQKEIKKTIPANYPYFNNMLVDDQGNIFLRTNIVDGKFNMFDVYSENGSYLDRVKLSREILGNNYCFKNGYLYQISFEDDDFAAIKKIKISLSKAK